MAGEEWRRVVEKRIDTAEERLNDHETQLRDGAASFGEIKTILQDTREDVVAMGHQMTTIVDKMDTTVSELRKVREADLKTLTTYREQDRAFIESVARDARTALASFGWKLLIGFSTAVAAAGGFVALVDRLTS